MALEAENKLSVLRLARLLLDWWPSEVYFEICHDIHSFRKSIGLEQNVLMAEVMELPLT
jgi:hypothetical protein